MKAYVFAVLLLLPLFIQAQGEIPPHPKDASGNELPIVVVEEMPEFPGGYEALLSYLETNTKYVSIERNEPKRGTVYVQFTVAASGKVNNVKVMKSTAGKAADAEALRIVKAMPDWKPGRQGGHPVDVVYVLPVTFDSRLPAASAVEDDPEPPLVIIDEMPQFPGGQDSLLNYFKRNMHYPEKEEKLGMGGTVYIQFTVTSAGRIRDAKVIKGITGGEGLNNEALRLVNAMPDWKPGKRKGNAADVLISLPVKFSLKPAVPVSTEEKDEKPFFVVDEMPEFPGGQVAMYEYISKNIVYPDRVKGKATSGTVYVQFTITSSGKVTNVKVIRGMPDGKALETEAMRVVRSMPDWKPGRIGGRPVSVYFTIPIKFSDK
jgi:TonB family protein